MTAANHPGWPCTERQAPPGCLRSRVGERSGGKGDAENGVSSSLGNCSENSFSVLWEAGLPRGDRPASALGPAIECRQTQPPLEEPATWATTLEVSLKGDHARPFVGVSQKSIFQRHCHFLAINAYKMAPITTQWLQERPWNAPTKGLLWVCDRHSATADAWNKLRCEILETALTQMLYPSFSVCRTPRQQLPNGQ